MSGTPAPLRVVRAAMFAAVCVALGALGHSYMSGTNVPLGTLTAAFAVTGALAWLAAGRRRGPTGIGAALLGVQAALHLTFSAAQAHASPPAATPPSPLDHDPAHAVPAGAGEVGSAAGPAGGAGHGVPGAGHGVPSTAHDMAGMAHDIPDAADGSAGTAGLTHDTAPSGLTDEMTGAGIHEGMIGTPDGMIGMPDGLAALPAPPDALPGLPDTLPGMTAVADGVHALPGLPDALPGLPGLHDMTAMAAHGGLGMIAAHVLAGLFCAAWLARGEAAVFRLVGVLGASALLAARPLARALALLRTRVAPVPRPPAHRAPCDRPRRLRGAVHAHTAVRRGPPGRWIARATAPGRPARA
ncbi:hypothetical protein AB0D46_12200 [Streptomyces sp. NPDC048383]|uniref:hypothetical protein n=1 Tax=Streptomyces sp. NPDC048383 TaxID=3155386 RepID=UPI003432C341